MTWPSARHFKVTVTLKKWKLKNDVKMMWNCPKCKKKQKKIFENFASDGHLKWRHSKWPWPSARHFKVTVTFERMTVTSLKWRADGQSQNAKATNIFQDVYGKALFHICAFYFSLIVAEYTVRKISHKPQSSWNMPVTKAKAKLFPKLVVC